MRVSCQWRDLLNRKRFGFGHDLDSNPGASDLALFCPACPQPGVNLPDNWKSQPEQCVCLTWIFSTLANENVSKMAVPAIHCGGWEFFSRAS